MRRWVVDYIQNVSSLLSQITTYREKDQITFASSQWSFMSLICIQYSELHSVAKPQAFPDLKILVLGASLGRNKFLTIPEGLVNEETIIREVVLWVVATVLLLSWKAYKQYLENTETKAELIDRFCKIHPARPQTLKIKRKCFIWF